MLQREFKAPEGEANTHEPEKPGGARGSGLAVVASIDLTLDSDSEGDKGEKRREEEAEYSSTTLDFIEALGVDEGMARRLKLN